MLIPRILPLYSICLLSMLGSSVFTSVQAADSNERFSIKFRYGHYDRDYDTNSKDRKQSGYSGILGYQSAWFGDRFRLGFAAQTSKELASSGLATEDLLAFNGHENKDHSLIAEAYVDYAALDSLKFRVGRQKHKSLLMASATRLLPSTFEGASLHWQAHTNAQLYASRYYKWSRRADEQFNGFATDQSGEGAIDYVDIVSVKIKIANSQLIAEYLHSDDYLQKWGITSDTVWQGNGFKLNTMMGLFGATDAGKLFVTDAESGDLDYDASKASANGRQQYSSLGAYLGVKLSVKQSQFGLYHSWIGDPWLEDSYAKDHGTNPFPHRTAGPDMLNKDEKVLLVEYKQDWQKLLSTQLTSRIAYAYGYDAENAVSKDLGHADERWFEIDLRWRPEGFKGWMSRLRYRDYGSSETGSVRGVKEDQTDIRLTLDYVHSF